MSCLILFIFQELNLPEAVVNRLQTVGLRFCGPADQALPRLRGALPSGTAVTNYYLIIQCILVIRFFSSILLQIKPLARHLMSFQISVAT